MKIHPDFRPIRRETLGRLHEKAERSRNHLVGERKAMQARIEDSYEIIATSFFFFFMSLYHIDISAPKSALLPKHRWPNGKRHFARKGTSRNRRLCRDVKESVDERERAPPSQNELSRVNMCRAEQKRPKRNQALPSRVGRRKVWWNTCPSDLTNYFFFKRSFVDQSGLPSR